MPLNIGPIVTAIKQLNEKTTKKNFTQSIDLSVRIKDVDLKQPKNRIAAEVYLPHEIAKSRKIYVIGSGDLGVRAKNLGLDVLDKADLDSLKGDKKAAKKFVKKTDIFIAGVDLMPVLAKSLGPVLGPSGKMPIGPPKGKGIIPTNADLNPLIEQYKKMVRIRLRNNLVVNCKVGTEEMTPQELAENVQSVVNFLEGTFEHGSRNIGALHIKKTMGPAFKIITKGD
jgi:large subunit ribosomal protein L1